VPLPLLLSPWRHTLSMAFSLCPSPLLPTLSPSPIISSPRSLQSQIQHYCKSPSSFFSSAELPSLSPSPLFLSSPLLSSPTLCPPPPSLLLPSPLLSSSPLFSSPLLLSSS